MGANSARGLGLGLQLICVVTSTIQTRRRGVAWRELGARLSSPCAAWQFWQRWNGVAWASPRVWNCLELSGIELIPILYNSNSEAILAGWRGVVGLEIALAWRERRETGRLTWRCEGLGLSLQGGWRDNSNSTQSVQPWLK